MANSDPWVGLVNLWLYYWGLRLGSFALVQSSSFSVMKSYLILSLVNLSLPGHWMRKENVDTSHHEPDNPFHFYSLVCLLSESVTFVFKNSEH